MTDAANGAFVLRPGEGRTIPLGSFAMSLKADGGASGDALTLLEAAEPAGFGPPLHIHHDCAEAFYVLEREYLIFLAGGQFDCPAGSFIYVPQGVEHGFRVGDRPSRKLNLYAPAAMVGYFDELSAALARNAGVSELDEIAGRNGMEITGPVPEGYV